MARRPRGSAAHQSPRQRNDRPLTTTPSPAPSTSTQAQTLNRIGDDQRLSANKSRNVTVVKDGKEIMLGDGEKTKKNDGIKTETAASSSSMPAAAQSPETDGSFSQEATPKSEVVELDTDQVLSKERDNVVKFQQQQKVIEEANKQKRALLSRAIEERRKMAKAEANKLVKIQQELNHLDTLLNADVGIIRDKIEIASLDYAAAQKRYERLEKEFIEAKMDLFAKSETKESLTEHLYTIINQNEVRKAKKLVELMEQLAMQISPEEMELSMPIIPQLTNFTAASTIHQPGTAAAHPDGAGGRGSTTSHGHQGLTDAESTAEDGGSSGSVVGGGGTGAKPNSGSEETNSAMGRDEQGGGGGELKSSGNKEEKMSGDEMRKVSENHEDSAKSNPQQPQHLENNNSNNHESSQGCDKELSNTVDKQTAVVSTRQSENENLKPQVQNSNDATVVLKNKSAGDSLTNNNNIQPTTTMTTTTMPAVVVQPSQSPSSENPASTGPSDSPSPPKDTTKAKGWSLPFT